MLCDFAVCIFVFLNHSVTGYIGVCVLSFLENEHLKLMLGKMFLLFIKYYAFALKMRPFGEFPDFLFVCLSIGLDVITSLDSAL